MKQMKRWLSAILAICLIAVMIPVTVSAASSGTCGENLTWTLSEDGVLTISGTGPMANYFYEYEDGYGNAPWDNSKSLIKTVVIEDGVTSIGNCAFTFCRSVTSVTIPDSITSIGEQAFASCYALTNVTIGNGVTSIGELAFEDCRTLNSVMIPNSVTSIDDSAFSYCEALTSLTIGSNVASIGDWAFSHCYALTSVTIPDSVTSIGECAFYWCKTLTSASIGSGVTFIDELAFARCNSLTEISVSKNNASYSSDSNGVLFNKNKTELIQAPGGYQGHYSVPNTVTSVCDYAFSNCNGLTDVTIPNNVASIGDCAFSSCGALTNVTIGSGVTFIGDYAFDDNGALTEIVFRGNAPYMESDAFYDTTTTAYYPTGNTTWTSDVMQDYGGTITWVPYEVEEDEDLIGSGSCGDNLTWTLDKDGLLTISGTGDMTYFDSWEDEYAPWYDYRESIKSVVIEEGVTAIGEEAFYYCENLTSVSIPNGVTHIGAYAFAECYSLTSVIIPDTVTAIGDCAFAYCRGLTELVLSENLEGVGDWAFTDCSSLTSLTIPDTLTFMGNGAFAYLYSLTSVTIPDSITAISPYAFKGCESLASLNIGSGVTSIGEAAFANCYALTSVTIPGSVTSIGSSAFAFCYDLTEISFQGDAPSIEDDVFYDVIATAYYLAGNATWTADVMQNYSGRITWVPYGVDNTPTLDAPTIKAANVASTGKIKLSWNAVEGAVKYELYRSTSENGEYTLLTTTANTSATNTKTDAGKTYYYKVVAIAEDGTRSADSNIASCTCDLPQPVVTLGNVTSTGKIKVMWDAIEGAVKYKVYYSTSKTGTYTALKTTTGTSLTHASAEAGKTYYYKVIALAETSAANSAFSAIKSLTCKLAQPTVTLGNVQSSGKIKIMWDAVEGAVKYKVYYSTSKTGTYKALKTLTGTSLTHSSAEAGKTYYYKVIALAETSEANSAFSAVKSRMCDLPRPDVSISLSANKPKVSWAKVDGAVSYKIYRATSKTGTYSLVKTTTAAYYKDTKAVAGKTYYYKVMAVCSNTSGNSAYSGIVSIKSK